MPFRFSLETLGRFRRTVERQRELELRQALAQVAALRRKIRAIHEQRAALAGEEARDLRSGTTAAQLHFDNLLRHALSEREAGLEQELAQEEELCRRRQEAFQHARQEREGVEVLRRQQLDLYLQQESRQEQRRLDDQFLLRREHLRRR